MTQEQINISHMQCWVFRLAQSKWNITPAETVSLFKQHDIFSFIEDCYDILKTSSYSHALSCIEKILTQKGALLT